MSYKWVTVKGSDGERSFKISASGDKHYVYNGSGDSLGTASSLEDAISIIKSKYGSNVWTVDIGGEQTGCFPSSTLILTPGGCRPISNIDAGDQVISFKRDELAPCVSIVTQRLDHSKAILWEIHTTAKSEPIRCTAIHAYLTARGWLQASQLRVGDELLGLNLDGNFRAEVTDVMATDNFELVHNLHTTGEHNFIAEGFVVHNFSCFREIRTSWHRIFIDPRWSEQTGGQEQGFAKSPVSTVCDNRLHSGGLVTHCL